MASVDWEALRMLFSAQFWRMTFLWTASILFSHLLLLFTSHSRRYSCLRLRLPAGPDREITRPVCVVTGATSGLGKAAAIKLAREGYGVILAGRNPELLAQREQFSKEASGKYFFGGKSRTMESSSLSGDTEIAAKLWSASSTILKEMELKADKIINS